MAITDDQCGVYHFKSPFFPGKSCEDIYNKNPESRDRSGYYWISPNDVYCGMNYTGSSCEDIYNNNPETGDKSGYYRINGIQWTYCNMTAIAAGFISTCAGVGGGWTRIVKIDISAGDDCPGDWLKDTYSNVSFCRVRTDSGGTCSSASFSTNGATYQRVCGRARGYQKGRANSFSAHRVLNQQLDSYYIDGISITYNSPRRHIWSYGVGAYDDGGNDCFCNCPCGNNGGADPPSFVGTSYYCESGNVNSQTYASGTYYLDDQLWDGSECYGNANCCTSPTLPWFQQELSESTTSDLEARICARPSFANGSPLIDQLELYIQ